MASGPLTDTELRSLTNEQEFTGETAIELAKRTFQEAAPGAARAITQLALHSQSERTRLNASTYVIERVLGRIQDDPPKPVDDPTTTLLKEVMEYIDTESSQASNIDAPIELVPNSNPQPVVSNEKDGQK